MPEPSVMTGLQTPRSFAGRSLQPRPVRLFAADCKEDNI